MSARDAPWSATAVIALVVLTCLPLRCIQAGAGAPTPAQLSRGAQLCDQADKLLADGRPAEALKLYRDAVTFLPQSPRAKAGVAWATAAGRRPQLVLPAGAPVSGMTFSPDGKTLVTVGGAGVGVVWDVSTGLERHRLPTGEAYQAAFSPDGRTLATIGTYDHRWLKSGLILWDTTGWARRRVVPGINIRWGDHLVAYSPDNRTVAVADGSRFVVVDTVTGKSETHRANASRLMFGAGGRILAVSDLDGPVYLWDTATWTRQQTIGQTGVALQQWSMSADGARLAGLEGATRVVVWEVGTGAKRELCDGDRAVAISADGSVVAADVSYSRMKLLDATTGNMLAEPRGLPSSFTIEFDPSGSSVATGSDDGKTVLWDVPAGTEKSRLGRMDTPEVFLSRGGGTMGIMPRAGEEALRWGGRGAMAWDLEAGGLPRRLPGLTSRVVLSGDGRTAASAATDAVVVWNAQTGQEQCRLLPPSLPLALSTDGMSAVALADTGERVERRLGHREPVYELLVWNTAGAGEPQRLGRGVVDGRTRAEFTPDGGTLVSSCGRSVVLWGVPGYTQRQRIDLDQGKRPTGYEPFEYGVQFALSPDGHFLAAYLGLSKPGQAILQQVVVWDIPAGAEAWAGVVSLAAPPVFGLDSRSLFLGSYFHHEFLDTKTWKKATSTYEPWWSGKLFGYDGKLAASIGERGAVHLWDAASQRLRASFYSMDDGAEYLVTTPQGYYTGTPGALSAIRWRVGEKLLPADAFAERFHKPELVAKALRGEPVP